MQSIDSKIVSRIYGLGRGAVFVPSDFLDIGSRQAVDLALHRLVKKDMLRRLARGLYNYPKTHPVMGVLSPGPDAIAKALAGKDMIRLQPSGAYAANLLGLSTQVPARIVYLTDGPSRTGAGGKSGDSSPAHDAAEHGSGRPYQRIGDPGAAISGSKARG